MKIFFVGMHNKAGMTPLDSKTMSGKMIDKVIAELPYECIKTNLMEVEYFSKDNKEIYNAAKEWHRKYFTGSKDLIVLLGRWTQDHFHKPTWCKTLKLPHPASCMGNVNKEEYLKNAIQKIKSMQEPKPQESMEENKVKEILSDAIENNNYKVVFGLQPDQIKIIEKNISSFEGAKYSSHIWEDIGKKIGWHPLTAALYYFRGLPSVSGEAEAIEFAEWIGNKYQKYIGNNWIKLKGDGRFEEPCTTDSTFHTTQELYKIYKQSKQ